jgi:hypothetical protein
VNRSKQTLLLGFILISLLLVSCAKVTSIDACTSEPPSGFIMGLWHGFIAPLSFFGSLISDEIAMYAVNNNGGWYDFGFVLGAGILFGGSSRVKRR